MSNHTTASQPCIPEPSESGIVRARGVRLVWRTWRALPTALTRPAQAEGVPALNVEQPIEENGRINKPRGNRMRGAGRVMFAGVLLLIVGTLNIIYGIGALDDANIFVDQKRYIFTNLNTMGWVLIILGAIQLTGGFSLLAGNTYGRVIGVIGGSLGAIAALFSIGGNDPWWSLAIFFLSVWVVSGIFSYGADESAARA